MKIKHEILHEGYIPDNIRDPSVSLQIIDIEIREDVVVFVYKIIPEEDHIHPFTD